MTEAPETTGPSTELAESFYAMLKKRGEVKSHRVLTYRCPKRCLLADVLTTAQGTLIHSPAYKLSPDLNLASSSESGRMKNTTDGDRRWKGYTYFIDQAANIPCNCDHLTARNLDIDRIKHDLDADIREVVL